MDEKSEKMLVENCEAQKSNDEEVSVLDDPKKKSKRKRRRTHKKKQGSETAENSKENCKPSVEDAENDVSIVPKVMEESAGQKDSSPEINEAEAAKENVNFKKKPRKRSSKKSNSNENRKSSVEDVENTANKTKMEPKNGTSSPEVNYIKGAKKKPGKKNSKKFNEKNTSDPKKEKSPTQDVPSSTKSPKKNRHKPHKGHNSSSFKGKSESTFPDYYIQDVVNHALANGVLISGNLRMQGKNYEEAYISSPDGSGDICILGIRNRNRALNGDKVAVDILPECDWRITTERLRDFKLLSDNETALSNALKELKIEDTSIENLKESYPECWQQFVQKTGRVVSILEKKHSRRTAGYLKQFQDKNPNFALFSPLDSCFPRMKIPQKLCPTDFFSRPQDFEEFLFIGHIEKWDLVSHAIGKLTHNLGSDKDINVRTQAILMEKGIDYPDEFSKEIENALPELPFVIPQDEIARRRDFRSNCVFTIDPLTARDLDDALNVETLENGNFKVGVHIADVSYFVRENTKLDQEAENRSTSVYLVQKVVPMLPRTLCEHLCSLNPGEDRLSFSVEWTMNSNGDIVDTWFGRSVICSAVKLAYEHAQNMIDRPKDYQWEEDELPLINQPWTAQDISEKVNILQMLAVKLRQKRVDQGALRLDQPKICFSLDKETGLPLGYKMYEHRQSNRLIEEFMLLANISVAKKIYDSFPLLAVLRCHPEPKAAVMERSVGFLKRLEIDIDTTSSLTIQQSLNNYKPANEEDLEKIGRWQVLMNVMSKPMQNALYFCSGVQPDISKYHHYALSVPLYTHFTSPIRRYPDILVHR